MLKKSTSYALSPKARELLDYLSKHLGISKTSVLELIIREKAEKEKEKAEHDKRP